MLNLRYHYTVIITFHSEYQLSISFFFFSLSLPYSCISMHECGKESKKKEMDNWYSEKTWWLRYNDGYAVTTVTHLIILSVPNLYRSFHSNLPLLLSVPALCSRLTTDFCQCQLSATCRVAIDIMTHLWFFCYYWLSVSVCHAQASLSDLTAVAVATKIHLRSFCSCHSY